MAKINLNDHGMAVLAQPNEAELRKLAEAGVKTVINLRNDGEDAMPMSVKTEGKVCERLGMDYVSLPVSMRPAAEGGADEKLAIAFEMVLTAAREAGPTAVHCKLGQRAGAMVLIALARHQGWDAATAIGEAKRLGLGDAVEPAKLRAYVTGCLAGPGR
ncbi:MAG: sulfur transferase domain-containing protein [Planctomycetota bacterium]